MKIKFSHLHRHESKRHLLMKFLVAVFILVAYVFYLVTKFGLPGFPLVAITWSAFVIATPIPDAGLILDFPLRVLFGIRMIVAEFVVWLLAVFVNVYFLLLAPELYEKTLVTHIFHQIVITPWPGIVIVAISALGTFLGMHFGDELLDVMFHHERTKYKRHKRWRALATSAFAILFLFYLYRYFLMFFGVASLEG